MDDLDLLFDRAELENNNGNVQKALNLYSSFIAETSDKNKCPGSLSNTSKEKLGLAYNNRGFLKYLNVDFEEAISDYTSALEQTPALAVAYYNRGMVQYRLSRFDQAIADLKECMNLTPDFEAAQTGLEMCEQDKFNKERRGW